MLYVRNNNSRFFGIQPAQMSGVSFSGAQSNNAVVTAGEWVPRAGRGASKGPLAHPSSSPRAPSSTPPATLFPCLSFNLASISPQPGDAWSVSRLMGLPAGARAGPPLQNQARFMARRGGEVSENRKRGFSPRSHRSRSPRRTAHRAARASAGPCIPRGSRSGSLQWRCRPAAACADASETPGQDAAARLRCRSHPLPPAPDGQQRSGQRQKRVMAQKRERCKTGGSWVRRSGHRCAASSKVR